MAMVGVVLGVSLFTYPDAPSLTHRPKGANPPAAWAGAGVHGAGRPRVHGPARWLQTRQPPRLLEERGVGAGL